MSPYSVRRALENTSIPVGGLPEDKLSAGQGLMQVDKLHVLTFLLFYYCRKFGRYEIWNIF